MENISDESAPVEEIAPAVNDEHTAPVSATASTAIDSTAEAMKKERRFLLLFGALIIGVTFWYLQFATQSVCCGDFDAYYHFRWSRMLLDGARAGQFPPSFDALPLTTLNAKDYVDHHFLFHVFQIPFTLVGDFQYSAKLGTWLFACLAVFSCYWLLVRYRISYPLVWLIAILGSAAPFLYRIHMGKAMSVSIVFLIAGIYLLFERRYKWLLPLAFVFALTYDMFLLLWVAAAFWTAVVLWVERRIEWRPLLFVFIGSLLGYVINPYFPLNLQLLYQHLVIKVTVKDFSTAVGGEWYPYNTLEFLGNCGPAFAAMIAGYIAFRDSTEKDQQRPLFFLLFSTFLMLVNMRWRRFSEYWPPFAFVFAAFALQPLVERLRARAALAPAVAEKDAPQPDEPPRAAPRVDGAGRSWDKHEAAMVGILIGASLYLFALVTHLNAALKGALLTAGALLAVFVYMWMRGWTRALVMAAALFAFAFMGWYHHITVKDIAGMPGPDRYRAGMEWITKNVPKGELVYNADWDDFPKLFFYDPTRPFVAGLDPTYLLDRNKELMEHYERIGTGKEEDPGPIIREKFCLGEGDARRCARYVFMDHEHEAFFNNALDSGWFEVAYEDDDCSILRIRDEKGDAATRQPPAQPDAAEQGRRRRTGGRRAERRRAKG